MGSIELRERPQDDQPPPAISINDFPQTELRRDLKERHVNMIAFSACVGIGLFLQSGKVIFLAGPGLAVISYLLAGSVMWCTMGSLGEMTALFPVQGSIFVFPARFLDVGVGYAAGWMTWFSWVVIIAAEILAVSQLWDFRFEESYLTDVGYLPPSLGWTIGQEINPDVWVLIFLIVILAINCLPVLWYGRLEWCFGSIKMVFIVMLIMFNIVVSAVQPVDHGNHGWTYNSPYGFRSQNMTIHGNTANEIIITGEGGVFLGMWSAITTVIFSVIGFESVSITAAECQDLERTETIKMATRKIFLRIILLYSLATLVVGFNVPYTDPNLRNLAIFAITPGQNSVFILAAVRNNLHGFPNFFNGVFIFSATTAGINALYLSSRILHALASIPEVWPRYGFFQSIKWRLERTTMGVPHGAVFTSWLFGLLAFLAANKTPAEQLGRMAINSVVSMLIVYSTVCLTYIQFYRAIGEAAKGNNDVVHNEPGVNGQDYDRRHRRYPYRSRGQWLKAVYGFTGCSLFALFNGWESFVTPFSFPDFVASYISIPIFVMIVMAYHVGLDGWDPRKWRRTHSPETNLINPHPQSVSSLDRVGHLRFPREQRVTRSNGSAGGQQQVVGPLPASSFNNLKVFGRWLWIWIK